MIWLRRQWLHWTVEWYLLVHELRWRWRELRAR